MTRNRVSSPDSRDQPDLFSIYPDEKNRIKENPAERDDEPLADLEELFEQSLRAYNAVISAEMNETSQCRKTLSRTDLESYIQKVLNAARNVNSVPQLSGSNAQLAARIAAEKAAFDRGDPAVVKVLEAAYQVDWEIHRLMGLLRFNPRKDGMWLARCAPDNFVLPGLAEHFTLRFREEPWAIIDEKRGLALVRPVNEEACLGTLASFAFLSEENLPRDNWEELWRCYHKSIYIENRKNPGLQRQLMPVRYWKYLPEKTAGTF